MGPFCVPVPGQVAFDFSVFIPSFLGMSEPSHGRAKKLRASHRKAHNIPVQIHTSLSPRYPLWSEKNQTQYIISSSINSNNNEITVFARKGRESKTTKNWRAPSPRHLASFLAKTPRTDEETKHTVTDSQHPQIEDHSVFGRQLLIQFLLSRSSSYIIRTPEKAGKVATDHFLCSRAKAFFFLAPSFSVDQVRKISNYCDVPPQISTFTPCIHIRNSSCRVCALYSTVVPTLTNLHFFMLI